MRKLVVLGWATLTVTTWPRIVAVQPGRPTLADETANPVGAVSVNFWTDALTTDVLVSRNDKVTGVATVATTGDVAVSGDETVAV